MYCLAFSEPAHGSDLAGIQTRGDVRGNEIVVTGVKTWVPRAHRAESALTLCRTGAGELSCVLVPLCDNDVELKPIRTLAGDDALFEITFDGARAPLDNLVGERGDGLHVAQREFRQMRWLDSEQEYWDLVQTARSYGRVSDPAVRQQLAWAYGQMRVIRVLAEREPALADVVWGEYHRRLGEIAVDIHGADSLLRADSEAFATTRWQHVFLTSRADTIAAGTSELQRDFIAERMLGLRM